MAETESAAVLVLRVWCEDDDPNVVRARITQTTDVTRPGQTAAVAGSVDDICAVVRGWLEKIVTGSRNPSRTSGGGS